MYWQKAKKMFDLGQVKKNNWFAAERSFSEILWSGGRFCFLKWGFSDSEVLILKYNKTYPYLLSLLHPSVQAYHINHKNHIGTQKT